MSEEFRFEMYDKIEEMARKTERKKLIKEFVKDLYITSRSLTIDDEIDAEEARRETIKKVNFYIKKWEDENNEQETKS